MKNDPTKLEHDITERLMQDIAKANGAEELFRALQRFQLWCSAQESLANTQK
jgi:hypothetical protein